MVFDFNGVIADDETPHLLCFQQALAEARLTLAKHDYYGAYSGMDERTCTRLLLEQRDGVCDEAQVLRITDRKADLFRALTTHHGHRCSRAQRILSSRQKPATDWRSLRADVGCR